MISRSSIVIGRVDAGPETGSGRTLGRDRHDDGPDSAPPEGGGALVRDGELGTEGRDVGSAASLDGSAGRRSERRVAA
ncbi:hypothetical protein A7982_12607 [Minicystis rosea]|nr:hypothetical protein A7982_12607 [Minicystis rosea]